MITPLTEEDRQKYREDGYHIIPKIIPASLLKDLRRESGKAQEIARRIDGPQAQRLSALHTYQEELDMKVFKDFDEIEGLNQAIQDLLTPAHFLQPTADSTILFGPRDRPWSTEWHRDFRDHIEDAPWNENLADDWADISNNFNYWNQVNCPLYEDNSTWYVPHSFQRVSNTRQENELYASTTQEILRDETNEQTDEALELFCLQYCQAMPAAVQLVLNPGDFCIYRNVGWHIGNYVPYRKRMTIHTQCDTPKFVAFRNKYFHLLNARAASLEKHRK
ncbi:MAG: hypothetical protein ACI92G_002670 [Candidatus Pelagisphaera sp.]|jgi:hypothetical protein